MKRINSLGIRWMAWMLSIVMVLGMLPTGVLAVEEPIGYATVESLTEGVSIPVANAATVEAAYAGTLNWVAADANVGRNSNGWWIGLKVTAPIGLNMETAQYTSGGAVRYFKDYNDSADDAAVQYIELWGLVKEEYLRSANLTDGLSTYTWTFDWDGDNTFEQTLVLNIDADQTVLLNNDGTTAYPAANVGYGSLELLTPGATITDNSTASVSINYNKEMTVDWVVADTSVGRYQDGWWVGVKINVPAGMTEEQVKEVQYISGSATKSFWANKDSQEGAAVHYLTMWIPLNSLRNGGLDPYKYQFDWNNDGLFEQTVILSVDASKVTLTKDGVQVYPAYGTVSTYTGGDITGSDSDITVLVKDASLNWSAADDSLGRAQGWWVGIKVEAPEELDASVLQNARYQTKNGPDASWTDKSFWSNKDSGDADAVQYIQLWMPLYPSSIEKFKSENRNITMWYRFDWDHNGTYEQAVTFSVDPTGNIVLNKVDQTGFGFADPEPANIWIGDKTFKNTADGGNGDGQVTYEIVKGADVAEIDPATGELTFSTIGTVTVRATKAADKDGYYNAATAEYTITAEKKDPVITLADGENVSLLYGLQSYTNAVTTSEGAGQVSYAITGENALGASVDETGKVTFADDKTGTAQVTVSVAESDYYNAATASYTITMANEQTPAQPYTLSGNKIISNSNWFTGNVTITPTDGYEISDSNALADNEWKESILWDKEVNQTGAPEIYLRNTQTGGITAVIIASDLRLDKSVPTDLSITYDVTPTEIILGKLFGFSKETVMVTVSAADAVSGITKMEYSLDEGESYKEVTADETGAYVFPVSAQYRGQLWLKATDAAGNAQIYAHKDGDMDKLLVVDSISPDIQITYETDDPDVSVDFPYNKNTVKATILVNETNFFEGKTSGEKDDGIVHRMTVKVTKTDDNGVETVTEYLPKGAQQRVAGAAVKELTWSENNQASILLEDDGDYVLEISYVDYSGNDSKITGADGTNGTVTYKSKVITIDKTAPVITVDPVNGGNFKGPKAVKIQVEEHNFQVEDFAISVKPKDILNQDVAADYERAWTHEGNLHTLTLTFSDDAVYTLKGIAYEDLAGNPAEVPAEQSFAVDNKAPENVLIGYDVSVPEKIIEKVSFGFYKADVTVKIRAEDITSGVDHFELTYTKDVKASDAHKADFAEKNLTAVQDQNNMNVFTASYTIEAEARGSIAVQVFDKAGNPSDKADAKMLVADTKAPKISVTFAGKDANSKVHYVGANHKDAESFEKAANAFYNGTAEATITVNEANFFEGQHSGADNDEVIHEVLIKVTEKDSGKVTEYLCAGAKQLVTDAETENIQWSSNGDTHTTTIELEDEGDYILEVSYTDYSGNEAKITGNDGVSATKDYTSKLITVDKTAPVVEVVYRNTDVVNTIDGRNYLTANQSAEITVTEHNFRAEDVAASVAAKNIVGNDVAVADFAAQLADNSNWDHNGDVHTAKVEYTEDANYTFDIVVNDLALNENKDYAADLFTIDTKDPEKLDVSYSTSFFEQVRQSITFGYYNAQMTVTITAEDETSGIYHFAYSYINNENVSSVNAELLNQAIKEADITYDGKKATATFTIPKMVLGRDNQFNGTVEFVAYDRCELNTEKKDDTQIIVDNISPIGTVSYNAPVQSVNDVAYYDGNIEATISINEANFESGDVVVTVTKDGASYPVTVAWHNNSVDSHTGSFVLTEDGDYIVSVQYKDKSGNQMTSHTSGQLTLDATAPVIKVSNIKANSANKDAEYGFVIEISDTNLDVSSMKPVLKAVVQNAQGIYETVEIDLGKAVAVVEGQSYTYTVENLTEDALYTLSCETKDLSGNITDQVVLEDGKAYGEVQFSINRSGSVFAYGNEFTEDLNGQYYVYSVGEDVVIVEINVDPIETYAVMLNGKELTEGTDYTTQQTSKAGEWSKRTYTISKDLFAAEGEYSIIVSSTDKTDTTAFSDVKNLSMAFVVDQTKPVLTITGLETGGRYQTDEQTVTLIPTDEGGRLNSLSVVVLDSNGNPLTDENGNDISVRFQMSGEELLKYLEENDGKIVFTIPEGLNNQVRIICNDCAVDAEDLTNEYNELFEKVTVSQNQLIIFYANTPLFIGVIVGILALIALIIILIKRKKDKEKNKTKAKA